MATSVEKNMSSSCSKHRHSGRWENFASLLFHDGVFSMPVLSNLIKLRIAGGKAFDWYFQERDNGDYWIENHLLQSCVYA